MIIFKRLSAVIFLTIFFIVWSSSSAQAVDCSIASNAIEIASKIRGLKIKRTVPCKLQDKQEVEQYLRDTIKTKVPKTRLRSEERIYKLLGLLPESYQYESGIVDLYTSQLGGYYDPEKDFYAMAAWMPDSMQTPIAVHELVHALQDQYHSIEKLLDHKTATSDQLMARSALIEGDATAVMLDYSLGLQGAPLLSEQDSVSAFLLQNISGALLSSSTGDAPQGLYAMMIFPYVSGLNFVHLHLKEGGYKAVDKVFSRIPKSTEEILHPEIYLSGERSYIEVEVEKYAGNVVGRAEKPIFEDTLGEFFITTTLSSQVGPAAASEAAQGWGGDKIALYELKDSSKDFMVWISNWDSNEDAEEFYKAMSDSLKKRFEATPVETSKSTSMITESFGPVRLELETPIVVLRMGG